MRRDDSLGARELDDLMALFDGAVREEIHLDVDEELYALRALKSSDRRGEVVFAVRRPGGGTLLHRKSFYGEGVFRLPTGGIHRREKVIEALYRELAEETGLVASEAHFLGVQECHLHYAGHSVRFASYAFHIHDTRGDLQPDPDEDIVEFREVSPDELLAVAENLRQTPPPHSGWGRWRALAHDFVYKHLLSER